MFTIILPCPNCHKDMTIDDLSVKDGIVFTIPSPLICPHCATRLAVKIDRPDKGPVLIYLDKDGG